MESTFHDCMEPEEQETFVNYSNSLKDLAAIFRVAKDDARSQSRTSGMQFKKRKDEGIREKELR